LFECLAFQLTDALRLAQMLNHERDGQAEDAV
jgi:hypothetical protein